MSQSSLDLKSLFGAALQAMADNRQQINSLDGYNGNHGDNMVENLRVITEALQARQGSAPAEALESAGRALEARGRGGTSPHYARGLEQAAQQFQGRSELGLDDLLPLLQMVLSSIPEKGGPPQPAARPAAAEGLAEGLIGMLAGQQQPEGNVLQGLMGMAGGVQAGPAQPAAEQQGGGELMEKLLPAAMSFLQAKQAGADNVSAGGQALMSALLGGAVNPTRAQSPRTAAGGLLAQSILKAALGR